MEILTTISEIIDYRSKCDRGVEVNVASNLEQNLAGKMAFVPTMGYLHEGHLSLVRLARTVAKHVIMSVYVNKTQFNSAHDFEVYPRDLARDTELARQAGVDVLYVPEQEEIYTAQYPIEQAVRMSAGYLADGYCGAYRPGHFDGVVLIVSKLFNIVRPDIAIFGEKDYQQLQVIRQLVRDLCYPIEIIGAPLIRDGDGLALSSRNARLSVPQRTEALKISQALFKARDLYASGTRSAVAIRIEVCNMLSDIGDGSLEYAEIVDACTLKPILYLPDADSNPPPRLLVAVWVGGVRLIDNIALY